MRDPREKINQEAPVHKPVADSQEADDATDNAGDQNEERDTEEEYD